MRFFLFTSIFIFLLQNANAQPIDLSTRIAQKLQDSLGLSTAQRDSIYAINIRLQHQKTQVRSQYTGTDSLQYHIQRIENTRDSLYKRIIADEGKYNLYKQKKRYLVSNN
jgi:hypothetical protein